MPARRFTDEQELEICRRYEAGESAASLARDLHIRQSSVRKLVSERGIALRAVSASRRFDELTEKDICSRYQEGASTISLAAVFGTGSFTIRSVLRRNNIRVRTMKESKGGLTDEMEARVCQMYLLGMSSKQLETLFGVTDSTICNVLKRNGIGRRSAQGFDDSVQHALDCTGHHAFKRECEFYLVELARYADSFCKPGIAFDLDRRAGMSKSEYGAATLRLLFSTRQEAFFLEQAVLDATRGAADCPEDLLGWAGASEVRAMPACDLEPIVLRLAEELEELGVWEFAARYVPMTAAQRAICQQRALAGAPACAA